MKHVIISVTEKEVFNGVLNANDAENNSIVFIRDMDNLNDPNVVSRNLKLAQKFVELNSDGKIDEDAKSLLDELKYDKVKKALPEANIHTYKVSSYLTN